MTIRYQISTWSSSTAMQADDFREVKRSDAALNELWRQIYAMLKSDAALDTERAWRLRKEFNEFAAMVEAKPLRPGYDRCVHFILRTDFAGILDHVIFRQERV